MKSGFFSLALLSAAFATPALAEFDINTGLFYSPYQLLDLGNGRIAEADVLMQMAEDGRFDLVSFSIHQDRITNDDGSVTTISYRNSTCAYTVDNETLEVEGPDSSYSYEWYYYHGATDPNNNNIYVKATGEDLCRQITFDDEFYYDPETGTIHKL